MVRALRVRQAPKSSILATYYAVHTGLDKKALHPNRRIGQNSGLVYSTLEQKDNTPSGANATESVGGGSRLNGGVHPNIGAKLVR